mgnify:CR=1 FL=1
MYIGIKELLNMEQTGFQKLFTDYQSFYTTNLLLNKEIPKLGISEHEILKICKKGTLEIFGPNLGF